MHLGRTKCFQPPAKIVDKLLSPRHASTAHFNLNPLCETKFKDASHLPETCMSCKGPYVSPTWWQWGLYDKWQFVGLDCHQSQSVTLTCHSYQLPVKADAVFSSGNMILMKSEILPHTWPHSTSCWDDKVRFWFDFTFEKLLEIFRG
jgi:hypothetical protein